MKSTILISILILFLNCASAEPAASNQTHAIGPYNISFDLIGVRNLESIQMTPEKFEVKISPSIRFVLYLNDKITNESLEFQIVKYDKPVAKDVAKSLANPDDASGMVEGIYGIWFVRWSMFSGFSSTQAIDDYVICNIGSSMSWPATERLLKTLRIQQVRSIATIREPPSKEEIERQLSKFEEFINQAQRAS
jgi:hypothetical protein